VRVKLRFADADTFLRRYRAQLRRGFIFIATRSPRPAGFPLKFEFLLSDGAPVFRGSGTVLATVTASTVEGEEPRRSGMDVAFHSLDGDSQRLLERCGEETTMPGLGVPDDPSDLHDFSPLPPVAEPGESGVGNPPVQAVVPSALPTAPPVVQASAAVEAKPAVREVASDLLQRAERLNGKTSPDPVDVLVNRYGVTQGELTAALAWARSSGLSFTASGLAACPPTLRARDEGFDGAPTSFFQRASEPPRADATPAAAPAPLGPTPAGLPGVAGAEDKDPHTRPTVTRSVVDAALLRPMEESNAQGALPQASPDFEQDVTDQWRR
jgi:hypothetical protein